MYASHGYACITWLCMQSIKNTVHFYGSHSLKVHLDALLKEEATVIDHLYSHVMHTRWNIICSLIRKHKARTILKAIHFLIFKVLRFKSQSDKHFSCRLILRFWGRTSMAWMWPGSLFASHHPFFPINYKQRRCSLLGN